MNTEALLHQLLAIRSTVDAMLCSLGGQVVEQPECLHPVESREVDTSGVPTWRCGVCGYVKQEE